MRPIDSKGGLPQEADSARLSNDKDNSTILRAVSECVGNLPPRLADTNLSLIKQHLSNFQFLQEKLGDPYLSGFQRGLRSRLNKLSAKPTSGGIVLELLQYFMDSFCLLLEEISKACSSFTLEAVKNRQELQRSQSANRKGWSQAETETLKEAIRLYGHIGSERLKLLSDELGRSLYSVQSKVHKLLRVNNVIEERHKGDNSTLENKIITVLKRFREGLTRQDILAELEKMYEMGQQTTWKKSASQLLCSSEKISKVKGTYRLVRPLTSSSKPSGQTTYKHRTERSLMELPNRCGTLRQIIGKYLELFAGSQPLSEPGRKSIEAGITRALKRSNDFDRRNSKTRYRYKVVEDPFPEQSDMEEEREGPSNDSAELAMSP